MPQTRFGLESPPNSSRQTVPAKQYTQRSTQQQGHKSQQWCDIRPIDHGREAYIVYRGEFLNHLNFCSFSQNANNSKTGQSFHPGDLPFLHPLKFSPFLGLCPCQSFVLPSFLGTFPLHSALPFPGTCPLSLGLSLLILVSNNFTAMVASYPLEVDPVDAAYHRGRDLAGL